MKNAQKMSDWQEEEKNKIKIEPCVVCHTVPKYGYYGRHGNGGTCCKECEVKQSKLPRFPEHTEEDFLRRLYASLSESETG